MVGTADVDTLIGVGTTGSDLLVGGSNTDTASYAVANKAIARTGQVTFASGSLNINAANIDVLTGMEQLSLTNTGYSATTNNTPSNNQLRSTIQSTLGNNSVATFTGVYDASTGNFSFGAADPNATLITYDSNTGSVTNYEAFLLLGKTTIDGAIGLSSGTVTLSGL